jgi:anthranilate synthase component 1
MENKFKLRFRVKKLQADTYTPVGIYLRLRDIYPCSLLLECTDYSSRTNAYSYLCFNPLMGIDVSENNVRYYYPDGSEKRDLAGNITEQVNRFIGSVEVEGDSEGGSLDHGFFGFTSFDSAILFSKFDDQDTKKVNSNREVPFLRYDFYKVVLTFNHFNDTLVITEYFSEGLTGGECDKIISLLANHNFTVYPFRLEEAEQSLMEDDEYKSIVREAIRHCAIGDVFQLVVS